MEAIVNRLDVEHHEVGLIHRPPCLFMEEGSAGVECRVESLLPAESEELLHKGRLHERFSPGTGHPTPFDETFVASHLCHQFLGCQFVGHRAAGIPGIGIMAEGTAHGTALEKGNKPYPGAIHGAERLDTVQSSFDHLL